MPDDLRSSTNSWRGTTMTTGKMSWINALKITLVIITIIGLSDSMVNAVPAGRGHQRTIRLCSKSLSDALYLVCRDRGGYNEPFSYSGEEYVRPSGPGLVEECCYRSCSLDVLEQYCKPAPDDKTLSSQDGIEESLRIVNLPYSSLRELVTERRPNSDAASESNERTTKSKNRNSTRLKKLDCNTTKGRKHVKLGLKGTKIREAERRMMKRVHARRIHNRENRDDDVVNDDVREPTRRECRRRRRWRRRRGKFQALREAAVAKVPEFKVGTTLPEPKDSLLMFPSRLNFDFQEVSKELTNVAEFENLEKFNTLDVDNDYRNKNREMNRPLATGRSINKTT